MKGLNADVGSAVEWARTHRAEATRLLAQATGVDPSAEARAVERMASTMSPMTDDIIREQQAVADRFLEVGLLPAPVRIEQLIWR